MAGVLQALVQASEPLNPNVVHNDHIRYDTILQLLLNYSLFGVQQTRERSE